MTQTQTPKGRGVVLAFPRALDRALTRPARQEDALAALRARFDQLAAAASAMADRAEAAEAQLGAAQDQIADLTDQLKRRVM